MDTTSGPKPASTLTFSCRISLRRAVETFTLTLTELSSPCLTVALIDIASIRLYTVPGMNSLYGIVARPQRFCLIQTLDGRSLRLNSPVSGTNDAVAAKTADFLTFVDALLRRVRSANPAARVLLGMPPLLFWTWLLTFGLVSFAILVILVFGSIGMMQQHTFGRPAVWFDLVLILIGTPAFLFSGATWRRRSQSAGTNLDHLWQRADRT